MAKEIKDKRLKNLGEGTSFVVITNHEVSWLCRSLVRTMPRWITVGGPKRTNNLSNRIYENRWGINNRVYVSSFLLHSPSDDFVPIWCFRVTVPLPTCVPSHERKKNTVEYRPELFLCPFFILERTCIHFVPIQRLILTQTLKLHCPTRSLSQRGTFSPLVFLFPLIVHKQRCSTRRALSTYRFFASSSAKCTVIAF